MSLDFSWPKVCQQVPQFSWGHGSTFRRYAPITLMARWAHAHSHTLSCLPNHHTRQIASRRSELWHATLLKLEIDARAARAACFRRIRAKFSVIGDWANELVAGRFPMSISHAHSKATRTHDAITSLRFLSKSITFRHMSWKHFAAKQ